MIVKKADMTVQPRLAWRGGEGAPVCYHLEKDVPAAWRFSSLVEFKPGESIGEHAHTGETELYYIIEGTATVWDNGTPVEVTAGDAIWTGNGASHSIKNTGSTVMRMLAIVITE